MTADHIGNHLKALKNMILVLMVAVGIANAQIQLDAGVKIIEDNDLAGQRGIYRFTVQVNEGSHSMKTFLPEDLKPENQDSPEICRLYLIDSTAEISSCVFDYDLNMLQFEVDPSFNGYLVYDLGYLINPSYSAILLGF